MKTYPFITQKYLTEIVPLARAKEWLEMDIEGYEGKDGIIENCIKSAIASVETELNFQLGISTYTWHSPCLPYKFNDTCYVKEIVSIKHGETVIDGSTYYLLRTSERSSVIIWYETPVKAPFYEIVFKAGLTEVEPDLLQAIRARIGEYYLGSRSDGVSEKRTLSDRLLTPFIIPYVG
ncbi:hypothetical protein [Dyadobacter sp. CY312]|uniref:hypothetical protein n=1 Tax=Dyadobacter sp. CY312 TaxID=2907303 RepID=UPI001F2DA458|nr:hypothetical protein [Dyadobacter sp. CY312]MCE7038988.1 hypothetical protein [Dyadobacter sp. CY312]